MKSKVLFYNGRILTQAADIRVDSMAICKGRIEAVGNNLRYDPDFVGYDKIDLAGRTVIPGLVDAHTHITLHALSLGRVNLDGETSLKACLAKIKKYAAGLSKNAWVVGEGYSTDLWTDHKEPDRFALDSVSGGRPAFIFSKDTHTGWANSVALKKAGISEKTPEVVRGRIERFPDGTPTGVLREQSAYYPVWEIITPPAKSVELKLWDQALEQAHRKGVVGVHSMDSPDGFEWLSEMHYRKKLGIRVNYYPPADSLDLLARENIRYGQGDDFLRIAGVKVFSDGALGSKTALCFSKYIGSKDNRGIEVASTKDMATLIRKAGRLNLPCAIHAIGDRAIANVLDAFEATQSVKIGGRHRIEHLQLIRRGDIARVKRLGVVASMQPSHCPSDIDMVRNHWGQRGRNAYIFRTLLNRGIDLAFGSDAPIEPLDPIAGIAAAVRRARPGSRDVFYAEERITAEAALHAYTVGPAIACGQDRTRGRLLPGYPADFVVLSDDLTRIAPSRIYDTKALATVIDGTVRYVHRSLKW